MEETRGNVVGDEATDVTGARSPWVTLVTAISFDSE